MSTPLPPSNLVLLDLDGTLTDSAPGIADCIRYALAKIGQPEPSVAELRRCVGPPLIASFARMGVPDDDVPAAIAAYREEFVRAGMWNNSLYPGILEQLALLREAGLSLRVATSKPEVFAKQICERFGITDLVDDVHGAPLDDQPSSKASVIAAALAAAGEHSSVLMVGDREHDVLGARQNGVDCLGVAWGYAEPGELAAAGAMGIVENVVDLFEAVQRLMPRR